jgi:hypothetical protein
MSEEERLQLENELLMTCSKSQVINNYIDELEESSKLSELWCKSQKENRALQQKIDKAIEYIENNTYSSAHSLKTTLYLQNDELYDLLEILRGGENNR